jgi:hypothetical protein
MVLSAFLQHYIYYKHLKSLQHAPPGLLVNLSRPVDFAVDVADFVDAEAMYNEPAVLAVGFGGMLTHVLNEGIFFKAADTRLEANYWQVGICSVAGRG